MLWIGLTGGLASGKSSVAKILRHKNIPVVCADTLARQAVALGSDGLKQVVAHFGADILTSAGEINRKKLAAQVFGHKANLDKLESIIHPIVRQLTKENREKLQKQDIQIAFYDVPLLFEKNMQGLFDKTVVVHTTEANQIQRAISRDKATEEQVKSRMSHQMALKEKIKKADFAIENNAGVIELEQAVEDLLIKLNYQPQE